MLVYQRVTEITEVTPILDKLLNRTLQLTETEVGVGRLAILRVYRLGDGISMLISDYVPQHAQDCWFDNPSLPTTSHVDLGFSRFNNVIVRDLPYDIP